MQLRKSDRFLKKKQNNYLKTNVRAVMDRGFSLSAHTGVGLHSAARSGNGPLPRAPRAPHAPSRTRWASEKLSLKGNFCSWLCYHRFNNIPLPFLLWALECSVLSVLHCWPWSPDSAGESGILQAHDSIDATW